MVGVRILVLKMQKNHINVSEIAKMILLITKILYVWT